MRFPLSSVNFRVRSVFLPIFCISEHLFLAADLIVGQTRQRYLQTEERKQESLSGHKNILSAIKNGDGAGAQWAMRQHLETVESIVVKYRKGGEKVV
jgi:DNA-binding FadR family transcriptional regulator